MALPPVLEELSPETVGEALIVLTLDPANPKPRAFASVVIDVDYRACEPSGVMLPLELIVQAPSSSGFVNRIITRTRPATVTFTPKEGGAHLVLLREMAHNRWLGTLRVQVAGDPLSRAPGR